MKSLSCLAASLTLIAGCALFPARASADPGPILRRTLANGLEVVIIRDTLAPVVSTVMSYRVGADDETITGLAHAQEHMMFRGSRSLSASQFAETTAITGADFNANTQNEITQYYFTMPSQYLGIALHLEASRSQGILDSQKLWDAERNAIEQEVTGDYSDSDYRLYLKELHVILAGSPYANEGLGTLESFGKQINAPQLKSFYRTWYHPNNALLVIAGDVQPEEVLHQVEALFGKLAPVPLPARRKFELAPFKPAVFREESDKSYVLANMCFRFPGFSDPDYAASQVLLDVLRSRRSDLYDLVVSGQALSADAAAETFPKAGLAITEVALPSGSKPEAAAALLRGVLESYRRKGVSEELVQAARQRELSDYEQKGNSIQGLAVEWSQALAVEHRKSPREDIEAIEKVRPEDVNRVLRRYLDPTRAVIGYSVPNNKGEVSAGGGKVAENNTYIPTEHKPLPDFAQHVLESLRVPTQSLHPTDMRLPNGLRLIVQHESTTHSVTLLGNIRHNTGLQTPPQHEGLDTLTETLLPYGTTSYDRLAYQRELDKIAASVDVGPRFGLSVLSSSIERGVQLLADDLLHPSFPQADFDTVKKQLHDQVVGEEQTPAHLASLALSRLLLPEGDPQRRYATPETVSSLTLDDVKAYHRRVYRPDLTTIVMVGDVTPVQARNVVAKYFGNWTNDGPKPDVEMPTVPDNQPGSASIPDTGRVQDEVTLTQTLRMNRKDPDYAPLRVANAVLSGGFYASLLFHDLREVRGYVYSVGSSFDFGRTRSSFDVTYGAMPENVDKAEAATVAELKNLQTTPLPAERLKRAKALLLGELPVTLESYTGVAGLLEAYAEADLPLNQNVLNAAEFLKVTPEQVKDALNRWIRPDGFVRIVEGPAPK